MSVEVLLYEVGTPESFDAQPADVSIIFEWYGVLRNHSFPLQVQIFVKPPINVQ